MNTSSFMDKQIMDLSRSNSNLDTNNKDLTNPQSEEEDEQTQTRTHTHTHTSQLINNDEILLPNYDFHPIHRPIQSLSSDHHHGSAPTVNSIPNSSPLRSYNSLDTVEPNKMTVEKAHKANDSSILIEIDQTMQKYTDSLMHAIDALSARLSQMESRTRHLEHSVEDLQVSIGNNHGSTDGKMRQLENILLEVKIGVQNIKDKQEVMEGHMQLAKLQISKGDQSPEVPHIINQDPVQQSIAASAHQQSGLQLLQSAIPQSVPSVPLSSVSLPSSQQNSHPAPLMTSQFPPAPTVLGPQRDSYFTPPSQTLEASGQQYQVPSPAQFQHQSQNAAPQPQQYQPAPTPPYPQPPQPPQQPHLSVAAANAPHRFQPPLAHHPEESPYIPAQTYPPNLHQPASKPSGTPSHSHPYYGTPSSMYEPPPSATSVSGFPSAYIPPSEPSEPYSYGGPPSHFGSGSSFKTQPHSPGGGGGGGGGSEGSYPQLPTARILPSIPTASWTSGGSSSGGSGNKVPIDDVVDKVTNMGFSREQVRATVRRLTENGQSVDLNVVLDKLMNDADVQPPRGWFGR